MNNDSENTRKWVYSYLNYQICSYKFAENLPWSNQYKTLQRFQQELKAFNIGDLGGIHNNVSFLKYVEKKVQPQAPESYWGWWGVLPDANFILKSIKDEKNSDESN